MSKYPDPIVHALVVGAKRTGGFVVSCAGLWVVLWCLALSYDLGVDAADMLAATRTVVVGPTNPIALSLFYGAAVIGFETVLVVYLLIALWWRGRGDVYRRGARLIDLRGE